MKKFMFTTRVSKMKQTVSVVLLLCLLIFCSACSSKNLPDSSSVASVGTTAPTENIPLESENADSAPENFAESTEPETTERKINLQINGQTYSATLYETPLADALYDMLPLTISFEDFNRTEKIGYLPDDQILSTEGVDGGLEPAVGDLCYYAPWGNLSLFYQSFRYSDDLYSIGHVDEDMSFLAEINESFTITFEKP